MCIDILIAVLIGCISAIFATPVPIMAWGMVIISFLTGECMIFARYIWINEPDWPGFLYNQIQPIIPVGLASAAIYFQLYKLFI